MVTTGDLDMLARNLIARGLVAGFLQLTADDGTGYHVTWGPERPVVVEDKGKGYV